MALGFVALASAMAGAADDDLAALCADRAAVERVYYSHRTGTKPPFEETLPTDQLRRLVRTDLAKEAALKKAYGVEITSAMCEAEVQRINATTRAPDVLAELKAALGNDPARFARTVAKPIVVERLLRDRYDNDDKLHASQRREAERVREQLLAARNRGGREAPNSKAETDPKPEIRRDEAGSLSNQVASLKGAGLGHFSETMWQLGARPSATKAPNPDLIETRKRFGPDAQIISSPREPEKDRRFYFEDLPGELQRVLRVQLRQPGDVSAVIETPGGFLLYVCQAKTAETLSVATLSLSKRSYEEWLAEQSGGIK